MDFHCEIGFGVRCLGKERILCNEHFVEVMPLSSLRVIALPVLQPGETKFKVIFGSSFQLVYPVNTL